jgi:hypothetical protein
MPLRLLSVRSIPEWDSLKGSTAVAIMFLLFDLAKKTRCLWIV